MSTVTSAAGRSCRCSAGRSESTTKQVQSHFLVVKPVCWLMEFKKFCEVHTQNLVPAVDVFLPNQEPLFIRAINQKHSHLNIFPLFLFGLFKFKPDLTLIIIQGCSPIHIHHFPRRPEVFFFVITPGAVFCFAAGEVPEEPRLPSSAVFMDNTVGGVQQQVSRCLGSCPSARHPPVLLDRFPAF